MKNIFHNVKKKAFTLVELIIVIAVITILAGIVVVAINPASIFQNARNSQRSNDMTTIQTAITRYLGDSSATPSATALARTLYGPTGAACTNATGTATAALFPSYTQGALCGGGISLSSGTAAAAQNGLIGGSGNYVVSTSTFTAGVAGTYGAYGFTGAATTATQCIGASTNPTTTILTPNTGFPILASGGAGATNTISSSSVDVSNLISNGYLPKLPTDPTGNTAYRVCIDLSAPSTNNNINPGKLVIFAPGVENTTVVPIAVI